MKTPRLFVSCLTLAASLATTLPAQPPELPVEGVPVLADVVGSHVVRPGETLESLALAYLGAAHRWREIWALNEAEVHDPDLIYPGREIRVPVPVRLPEDSARLTRTARRVEDRRVPRDWEGAESNDLLRRRDGLRTFEGASAELVFADETALVLTEQSLVFLGVEPAAPSAPAPRRDTEIEIEFGQADLESGAASAGGAEIVPEIVIVMGDAVATPRPAAGERLQTRSRRPESGGGAQLMVYRGSSDLQAGGMKVEVAEGMGSTASEGGAPTPPERLLDAPVSVAPAAGSRWEIPNPAFAWEPVAGARHYTLEVCRDPRCTLLERRLTDLADVRWRPDRLPDGDWFWRVTATSASGLDGYPSPPLAFTIAGQDLDLTPPWARVLFRGPQVGVENRRVLGVGASIDAEVNDDGTGLESWATLLDGAETPLETWRGPWSPGPHTVSIRAVDKAGNVHLLDPVPFVYDPDPPRLAWGLEDGPELGVTSGATAEPATPETPDAWDPSIFGELWARITGAAQSPLVWSSSRLHWLPLTFDDWRIGSDEPYLVVRARKKPVAFADLGLTVTREHGLWIHLTDPGCGVERLRYQLFGGPYGDKVLVFEASDALENVTRVTWRIARAEPTLEPTLEPIAEPAPTP